MGWRRLRIALLIGNSLGWREENGNVDRREVNSKSLIIISYFFDYFLLSLSSSLSVSPIAHWL